MRDFFILQNETINTPVFFIYAYRYGMVPGFVAET